MRKTTKVIALAMASCMVATAFAGCGGTASSSTASNSSTESKSTSKVDTSGVKEIYYLNFKPEIADKYQAIADKYKEETGITVKIDTAASNEYEKKLQSEMAKSNPPTIFQINGPVGYSNWADYCANLKDSELYTMLNAGGKELAVSKDDGVYGVPYAIEGYGIIYNNEIMDKYFASSKKTSSVKSTAEINSYAKLKEVVEDMTKLKDELGIDGVFGSTSMSAGNDWRWQTHLANLPLYYEFKEAANGDATKAIETGLKAQDITFKYNKNYQNIFDLYTNNSCTEKSLLSSKSVDDSMAEFALGKVAMIQNGNWGWSQISKVDGNVTKENNVKFLPIYTGVEGEEKQGICIGTENYFAINSTVDEATQQASIDFLVWLFSSDYGKKAVTNELGFITPFSTFSDSEQPTDPLAKEVLAWQAKEGIENPVWLFTAFPSEQFKSDFGAALLEYVQGQKTWDDVSKTVTESWKTERAATAQ
ncbi:MAG TPA: ABC transporter substrate-binding protein [Clostridiales bacterium]|nr:ABC transporter substrate-binding protein [Clostridiales bacterium]